MSSNFDVVQFHLVLFFSVEFITSLFERLFFQHFMLLIYAMTIMKQNNFFFVRVVVAVIPEQSMKIGNIEFQHAK